MMSRVKRPRCSDEVGDSPGWCHQSSWYPDYYRRIEDYYEDSFEDYYSCYEDDYSYQHDESTSPVYCPMVVQSNGFSPVAWNAFTPAGCAPQLYYYQRNDLYCTSELDRDVDFQPLVFLKSQELKEQRLAECKKDLGNAQFKLSQYAKALPFYTEAIDLCPQNASYYGNRAACYLMQGQYSKAIDDALQSVAIDPKFVKGWIRVAKCCLARGDIAGAESAISRGKEVDPSNTALQLEQNNLNDLKSVVEKGEKAYASGDYRMVVYCMVRALAIATSCTRFKILKAECLALIGQYQEAQELANEVLAFEKQNADAILVRGMCLYYLDNIELAFSHFQLVLKLAPDHAKALEIYKIAKALKQKKEEGNEAYKAERYQDALRLYSEALNIDPKNVSNNAKLYFNRATVLYKLKKTEESLANCSEALKLDPNYVKALLRRAQCHMDLAQYEEAVQDYEKAAKLDKSREIKKQLQDAKMELKKSQRKDYYKILGISKDASTEDIKKAYRKRALVHHPDRHANASEGEKKEQEKKFKEVGEAYGILSDPQKRAKYDNGQDLEDFGGFPDAEAAVYQAFRGHFFTSSSFPGSFSYQYS